MISGQQSPVCLFWDCSTFGMSGSFALVTAELTVVARRFPKYCLSLMCWMWLFQTDKFIVLEGSVNSASLTILVACSVFTGSPSHLMQPDTMKFPELWFLRIVPTDVAVIGAGGQNGN